MVGRSAFGLARPSLGDSQGFSVHPAATGPGLDRPHPAGDQRARRYADPNGPWPRRSAPTRTEGVDTQLDGTMHGDGSAVVVKAVLNPATGRSAAGAGRARWDAGMCPDRAIIRRMRR